MTRETRYIILFVLAFVALGLWQHLYFSYSVGEPAFFKNAYDEDTYVLFPFGPGGVRPDRLLSGAITTTLLWLFHGSYSFTLIALDSLLPPLVFLAAYFAGAVIFARFPARCLFALVLVFSSDLFSLGSVASYPGPFPTLDQFRALVGSTYVPPIETSYLGLYRSPEPQVSYVIGFLFIGLLARIVLRDDGTTTRRETIELIIIQALLMMCYALISYPLLLVEGCAAIILLLAGRRQKAILLTALFFASVIAAFVFARMTLGTSFLFASRLPIVTVGVILALALTIAFFILLWRRGRFDRQLMFGLAFAGVPLVLTNQQVLTGTMVSVKEFERYIDLPFVVVATGLLIAQLRWRRGWRNPAIALATMAVVVAFVSISSYRTYKFWLTDNLTSLAIARAVTAADASLDRDMRMVLDQPEYAPLVEARLGRPLHALLDYTDIFKNPILPSPGFRPTPLAESLFEYWRQTGITPVAARAILEQETRQRGGYYTGFLFNVCEYWYPCTDGRSVKTEKITAAIPTVIDAYSAVLAKPAPSGKFAFVTSKSPPDASKSRKVGEGRVASITAQVSLRR